MHAAILVSIAYPPLNCKMERYGKKTHTVEWDYQKQKEKTLKEKKKQKLRIINQNVTKRENSVTHAISIHVKYDT